MPDPKDITLHASAAETSAGTGAALDAGNRTYTEVLIDVTAIASSTTLNVVIESSPTQSAWTALGFFKAITTQGARTLVVPDGQRYLRARWTVDGTSATFAVTARAHQLYVLPSDLAVLGMTLDNFADADIARACLTASSEAEGYLATSTPLPIAVLDDATQTHVARMALYELFRFRSGLNSNPSPQLEIGRSDALTWLNRIATGKLKPPGLVDATGPTSGGSGSGSGATTVSTSVYVVSKPLRGW